MATTTSEPTDPLVPIHSLPPPFSASDPSSLSLITQGAEALLYHTTFLTPTTECALKVRPKKTWRHPTLDKRLTRQRILAEVRVLVKLRREGVAVPAVLGTDWETGWVAMEWVSGRTVKEAVRGRTVEGGEKDMKGLLGRVGKAVGKLHSVGVVHGDLTTSNMMIRSLLPISETDRKTEEIPPTGLDGEIVLIDFGLALQSVQEEERAVDLYVLERAFGSTHPREEGMFGVVLEAYGGSYKGAKPTLRRLEDVRMRGRKKSMIG